MVNQQFYELGTAPSVIRQLFAYGLEQAAKVGADKVFDYSLGNPSIPAPKKVNESIHTIVDTTDSIQLHGYSMANGFEDARAAVAKDKGEAYNVYAAMAKLMASDVANEVTRGCVQLLGGYGYAREYTVERFMRDAKITEIYEGTSEVMKMVISGSMNLK